MKVRPVAVAEPAILYKAPMHNTALIQYLSESPTFSKAGHPALHALDQNASIINIEARQHLFHMGEPANYFYLVHSGSITLYRPSYGGDHKVFRVLEAGDLLAETAMFIEPSHYPLSAQVATDATVYRISREALLSLVRQSPEFSFADICLHGHASHLRSGHYSAAGRNVGNCQLRGRTRQHRTGAVQHAGLARYSGHQLRSPGCLERPQGRGGQRERNAGHRGPACLYFDVHGR